MEKSKVPEIPSSIPKSILTFIEDCLKVSIFFNPFLKSTMVIINH